MIALAMPVGSLHGWGVCGKYLTRELAALTGGGVRLLTPQFGVRDIGDELEFQALAALLMKADEIAAARVEGGVNHLPCPLLTCITDKRLLPAWPQFRGTRTVAYTFFEENVLEPAWIENARRNFEVVVAGSSWCAQVLKAHGLQNVHTVVQGVDPRIFFPWRGDAAGGAAGSREFLRDRFVIFSGGKFELRKGQDVVIRAVKVLQERHADVVLVNAWHNAWQNSIDSMRASPHLHWPAEGVSAQHQQAGMQRLLAENGLDLSRVITLAPRPNALMARVYRNSDVGIFPNRCEGGTNLVLMEFMACGRPVVATATTGHSDIITRENSLVIGTRGDRTIQDGVGMVPEPDVDDAIEKLEWAYQNRAALASLGARAGDDLAARTWTKSAADFLKLLT